MQNLRVYGASPYGIAVIHGGPGAPGEMAPVARELSKKHGVLEPLQTETTLEGQLDELKSVLEKNAQLPVVLIGHSWGAFLSCIFTAKYPALVKKLILVGSGPFEQKYAEKIMETRLSRLSEQEQEEAKNILQNLNDSSYSRFGELMAKADRYNPLEAKNEVIKCNNESFQNAWAEVEKLRKSGELLEMGKNISIPVVAIHGDYDPHPYEGIKKPLSQIVLNFKFVLLKNCGHDPWLEKEAKEKFFEVLQREF